MKDSVLAAYAVIALFVVVLVAAHICDLLQGDEDAFEIDEEFLRTKDDKE